ncbi:MAG: hypothetical protein J2P36_22340 [Ktedonobacteraceae bacterium]|nr:hypothetical protein [Ktedonobacteraceae bacterium]
MPSGTAWFQCAPAAPEAVLHNSHVLVLMSAAGRDILVDYVAEVLDLHSYEQETYGFVPLRRYCTFRYSLPL